MLFGDAKRTTLRLCILFNDVSHRYYPFPHIAEDL